MIIVETPRPRDASCLPYCAVADSKRNRWGLPDSGAKPDRSSNADSMQGKFRLSNMTKHLEHSMKLKECSVFDCYNKASTVSSPASSPANAKDCSAVTAALGFVSAMSSHGVVKFIVITVV